MGVELIMGMEEVINYLKQLEAENKQLKEDLEKAWDQRGDKWRKSRIKKLQEENKKLKEELQWHYDTRGDILKKLKETIDKLKE